METELVTGAVTTWFYVIGDKGAVQFMLTLLKTLDMWLPMDLGVHYIEPQWEGQEPDGTCSVVKGNCYFQPSHKGAVELFDRVGNDLDVIWIELEALYGLIFD